MTEVKCHNCGALAGEYHKPDCESKCPGCGVSIGFIHLEHCTLKNANTCSLCGLRDGQHAPNCSMKSIIEKLDKANSPRLSRQKASELLMHTEQLINGERSQQYGEPHESFENIAKLWSTYLHHEITITDVGMMMILLKVARNGRGRDKPDNFVDICGYAALTGSKVFKNDDSK